MTDPVDQPDVGKTPTNITPVKQDLAGVPSARPGYVWMRHPNLEELIHVPESATGHHSVSGWAVCDPPSPPKPEPEPVAEAAGSVVEPQKPARRQRAASEKESS